MTETLSPEHTISADESMGLLGSRSVGRVGHVRLGMPRLLPVHHRLHDGSIVFRTDDNHLLNAVLFGAVAFEVDAIDSDYRTGWSVVVHGDTKEVWRPEELQPLWRLPLRSSSAGARDHFVRICPREINGRRIR